MKLLITGADGMLGSKLVRTYSPRHSVVGVDLKDFDITDAAAVSKGIAQHAPDVVIHCAAYTAVDKAEDNRDLCFKVNEHGTENIARAADTVGAKLIYFSTDYVFDGSKRTPYVETDAPSPLGVYGASKLGGERAVAAYAPRHCIVRIAWLFGEGGKNIIETMIRLGTERPSISFVNDQFGSPTYTGDVAAQTEKLLGNNSTDYGIFHCTAEGICTWYDVAVKTLSAAGIATPVKAITTSEYPTRAVRPAYSYLENARFKMLGIHCMPQWETGIERYVKNRAHV